MEEGEGREGGGGGEGRGRGKELKQVNRNIFKLESSH
jgi:hypothetical protein